MRWIDYNPVVLGYSYLEHQNEPDGGSGGDTGGGGGTPGTTTGTSQPASGLPVGENGGLNPATYYLMVPVQDVNSLRCYVGFFDITSFNDPNDDFSYSYRSEDISLLRVPTVRRIGLVYRDLGVVRCTFTLTGTTDSGALIKSPVTVQLGTAAATGVLVTKFIDVVFTGFRPQLTISRSAGDGPLSIISVTLIGEVEQTTL